MFKLHDSFIVLGNAGIHSEEQFGIPNLSGLEVPYISDTLNVANGHNERSHPVIYMAQDRSPQLHIQNSCSSTLEELYRKHGV